MNTAIYHLNKRFCSDFQILTMTETNYMHGSCENHFVQVIDIWNRCITVKSASSDKTKPKIRDKITIYHPYCKASYKKSEKRISYSFRFLRKTRKFLKYLGKSIIFNVINIQQVATLNLSKSRNPFFIFWKWSNSKRSVRFT